LAKSANRTLTAALPMAKVGPLLAEIAMARPALMWPLVPATLLLLPLLARAGEVAPPSVANDFPGWTVAQSASGDLNGDGRSDTALTLLRQDRDEGQAVLAVYLAGDKGQRLQVRAPKAVCIGCAGPKGSPDIVVGTPAIANGVLTVNYFGGSREVWNYLYKWRFSAKSGRFALIGATLTHTDTIPAKGNGPVTTWYVDANFLSGKMQVREAGSRPLLCPIPPGFGRGSLAEFDFDKALAERPKVDKRACVPAR
jgi:hypothetical protein